MLLSLMMLFQASFYYYFFGNSIPFCHSTFMSRSLIAVESYYKLRILGSRSRLHDYRHFITHGAFATKNADPFTPNELIENFDKATSASVISTVQYVTKDVVIRNQTVYFENDLKVNIRQRRWDDAKLLLSSLKTFITSEVCGRRRTVLYVILETCRRTGQIEYIIPLLRAIPKTVFTDLLNSNSFSDDFMPFLSDAATEKVANRSSFCCGMNAVQEVLDFVRSHIVAEDIFPPTELISLKAYSLIVKGYGLEKNERMLEKTLRDFGAVNANRSYGAAAAASVNVDVVFLNSVMDAYIRCENTQKCLNLFKYSVSRILQEEKEGSPSTYLSVWQCFKSKRIVPNVRTFNILLKAYRDSSSPKSYNLNDYMTLLQEMKAYNIQPDTVTLNTLVDAVVRSGNVTQAMSILNDRSMTLPIQAKEAAAGVEAYTSLVAGFAQRGDIYGAFNILDLMVGRGVTPNAKTLGALMNACMQSGQVGLMRAKELLKMEDNKYLLALTPSELTALHGAYVIGLCRLFRSDTTGAIDSLKEAQSTLISMARSGIAVNTATINSFLQALCSLPRPLVTESLLLLTAMTELSMVAPDEYTYSTVFTFLGKAGFVDQAMRLYHAISSSGVVTTEVVNSLLGVYMNSTQPLVAVDIFNTITRASSSASSDDKDAVPSTAQAPAGNFLADKVTYTILFMSMAKFLSREVPSVPVNSAIKGGTNSASIVRRTAEQIDLIIDRLIQVVARRRTDSRSPSGTPQHILSLNKIYNLIDLESSSNAEVEDFRYSSTQQASNLTSSLGTSDLDSILYSIFYKMRYNRGVQPDLLMTKVLNSLFAVQLKNIRKIGDATASASSTGGGGIKRTFSQETARFVLDELIIAGFQPRQMLDILGCCGFSVQRTDSYLKEDSNVVSQLRSSPASYKIFKKYKWNKVDSGWSSFF